MALRNPFSRRPPAWMEPEGTASNPADGQPAPDPTTVGDDDPTTIKSRPPETGAPVHAMDQSRPGDHVTLEQLAAAAAAGDQPMSRQVQLGTTTQRPPADDKPLRRGDVASPNLGAAMPVGDTSPAAIYENSDPPSTDLVKNFEKARLLIEQGKGQMEGIRKTIHTSKEELRATKADIKRRRAEQAQQHERDLGTLQASQRTERKELEERIAREQKELEERYAREREELRAEHEAAQRETEADHTRERAEYDAKQKVASDALAAEQREAEQEHAETRSVLEGELASASSLLTKVDGLMTELNEAAFFARGDSYNRRTSPPPAMPSEPPGNEALAVSIETSVDSVAAAADGFEGEVPADDEEDDDNAIVPGPTN